MLVTQSLMFRIRTDNLSPYIAHCSRHLVTGLRRLCTGLLSAGLYLLYLTLGTCRTTLAMRPVDLSILLDLITRMMSRQEDAGLVQNGSRAAQKVRREDGAQEQLQ